MVHSAVKRQRSYILESEATVPLDQVEHVFSQDGGGSYMDTSTYSPDDPQALLQALLKFLSDGELASLIITRLSKAVARKAPLYLTTLCIEGVHDFFRPLMPTTDSVQKSGLEYPEDPLNHNPFGRMPMTRRDSERLTGKFNIPSSRKNSPALLMSLATFFSFLEPAELRIVIQKRISDSVSPHKPIACFLEFLQSGGDDLPWGKVRTAMRRSKTRENFKAKKERERLATEPSESSTTIPPAVTMSSTSSMQQASSHADIMTIDPDNSLPGDELEDGEISPQLDSDPPGYWAACSPELPSIQGTMPVPFGNHILSSGAAPPPKKKRKKKSTGVRPSQKDETSVASPVVESIFPAQPGPSNFMAPTTSTPFPHLPPTFVNTTHCDLRAA